MSNETADSLAWEADAPAGMVWRCGACGKRNHNRLNWTGGWDESCALHARLVKVDVICDPHPSTLDGILEQERESRTLRPSSDRAAGRE